MWWLLAFWLLTRKQPTSVSGGGVTVTQNSGRTTSPVRGGTRSQGQLTDQRGGRTSGNTYNPGSKIAKQFQRAGKSGGRPDMRNSEDNSKVPGEQSQTQVDTSNRDEFDEQGHRYAYDDPNAPGNEDLLDQPDETMPASQQGGSGGYGYGAPGDDGDDPWSPYSGTYGTDVFDPEDVPEMDDDDGDDGIPDDTSFA